MIIVQNKGSCNKYGIAHLYLKWVKGRNLNYDVFLYMTIGLILTNSADQDDIAHTILSKSAWLGPKLFNIWIVFLKVFEKIDFEKKTADSKKGCKNTQGTTKKRRCTKLHVLYSYSDTVSPRVTNACNVPVSCKSNGDRNQLWAWLNSDP